MKKPFTVGNVREIIDAHERGEISYSKMVEMFNEIAMSNKSTSIERNDSSDDEIILQFVDKLFLLSMALLVIMLVTLAVFMFVKLLNLL